jgi:serine O-acetyltransferase
MKILEIAATALSGIRLIPHAILFVAFDRNGYMHADAERWAQFLPGVGHPGRPLLTFVRLMTAHHEFRNLFYARAGTKGKLFAPLCSPMSTLFINTRDIGPGLFIQHGFATVISAAKIGRNCWINQQVTIGYLNSSDCPTLGDNVMVTAGAKIIGGVTVGDNSKIGANAVVLKNVPPDVTVVGVPAYIVKRNGMRVTERL